MLKTLPVVETVLLLMIAGYVNAQDRGWYDVSAVD